MAELPLSSSQVRQSPAGGPLSVHREAQGNYQEFGTEVSLTLDDERYTFSGLARTKKTREQG